MSKGLRASARRPFFIALAACAWATAAMADDASSGAARVTGRLQAGGEGRFIVEQETTSWALDFSLQPALRRTAEGLSGHVVEASGEPVVTESPELKLQRLRPRPARTGPGAFVILEGVVRAGVLAIGGETTGITLLAAGTTWELALRPRDLERVRALHGEMARIEGRLVLHPGVEIRRRKRVEVASFAPIRAGPRPQP